MNNPKVDVTNSTSVELEIFDVYNATGKTDDSFTYTSLGKVAPGATASIQTIHFASQLQAMASGSIPGLSNKQSQFPVAVLAVSVLSDVTSYTIDDSNVTAMVETYNFIRYVNANPGSKIGKQFTAALGEKDQKTQVDAFFASSASFKHCTMSTWSTLTFWEQQYLSPWQSSFYLYQSGEHITEIKLVAGVNIIVNRDGSTTANLGLVDANGQWSKESQVVELAMSGGTITEKDEGASSVSVSLSPLWGNAQQKQNGSVKNVIAPVLTGVVNNTKVMGNFIQMTTPSGEGAKSSAVESWIDKQLKSINIQTVVGLLISFAMLLVMMRGEKNAKVSKSKDPVKEKDKIESEQEQIEQNTESEVAKQQSELSSKVDSLVEQINQQSEQIKSLEQKLKAQELLDSQKEKVKEILEEAPANNQVEKVVEGLGDSEKAIERGDYDGAINTLAENANVVEEMVRRDSENFSEKQQEVAKEVQEQAEEAKQRREEEQQAEEQLEEDKNKGSEEPVEPDLDAETSNIEFGEGRI
ncbi:MAG: hypothetical protein AAFO09_08335 [Pseudomonadota bacterium]